MAERGKHIWWAVFRARRRRRRSRRLFLEILGPRLRSLPDGETGERRNWVISIIEALGDHRDLRAARRPATGRTTTRSRCCRSAAATRCTARTSTSGMSPRSPGATRSSARSDRRRWTADLVFQEGVPGDFDLAMFTLGPAGALRHRSRVHRGDADRDPGGRRDHGPDTLFQIEVPAELVLLAKAPPQVRPALAKVLARPTTGLAAGSRRRYAFRGASVPGRHEQQGLRHDGLTSVRSCSCPTPSSAGWPAGPAAFDLDPRAVRAPRTTRPRLTARSTDRFRTSSSRRGTRFSAGFAHESQSIDDQRTIRGVIEEHLGGEIVDRRRAAGWAAHRAGRTSRARADGRALRVLS